MARGQTHIDFVAGLAIFLVTVLFVAAFMHSILTPFDDQATVVVADRVANDLAGTLLASAGPTSALNERCTLAFFVDGDDTGCNFDNTSSITNQLGIERTFAVNVTLRRNVTGDAAPDVLCYDDGTFGECTGSGSALSVGPPLPDSDRAVAGARRVVLLDGQPTVLVVKVW